MSESDRLSLEISPLKSIEAVALPPEILGIYLRIEILLHDSPGTRLPVVEIPTRLSLPPPPVGVALRALIRAGLLSLDNGHITDPRLLKDKIDAREAREARRIKQRKYRESLKPVYRHVSVDRSVSVDRHQSNQGFSRRGRQTVAEAEDVLTSTLMGGDARWRDGK